MKSGNHILARKYAQAFMEALQGDAQKQAAVYQSAERLQRAWAEMAAAAFWALPYLSVPERQVRARALFEKLNLSSEIIRWADFVIFRKRDALFPFIITAFIDLYRKEKQIYEVFVRTSVVLSEAQLLVLEKQIKQNLKLPRIQLACQVDEALIGGMVLRVNGRVWDRSLGGALQWLKQHLV